MFILYCLLSTVNVNVFRCSLTADGLWDKSIWLGMFVRKSIRHSRNARMHHPWDNLTGLFTNCCLYTCCWDISTRTLIYTSVYNLRWNNFVIRFGMQNALNWQASELERQFSSKSNLFLVLVIQKALAC